MRITELIEAITPEQINVALSSDDPARSAMDLLKSQQDLRLRPDMAKRQSEMRDEINRVAVIRDPKRLRAELEKILWKWAMSLDGLRTGVKTNTGRKGPGVSW